MAFVSKRAPVLPTRPVQRFTQPLIRFLHIQSMSGIVLAACAVIALAIANSSMADSYRAVWEQTFRIGIGEFELAYPLWYWINDALMAIFFFLIGLEIKRELITGELRDPRQVVLPVAAAIGGACIPVGMFLLLLGDDAGRSAWAVPMATDIAFVVGCLALLGSRVPRGLKVFMLSLAIVDDILAVVVIALFYSDEIKLGWGLASAGGIVLTVLLNKIGVRRVGVYWMVGAVVWLCCLKSGIHPTVAGVILGLLTPASAWLSENSFHALLDSSSSELADVAVENAADRKAVIDELSFASQEAVSPLVRLESDLHPWVAFIIMPVFALANAAVPVSTDGLQEPIAVAIAVALFVGKPVGIVLASVLFVRAGWASLPDGVSWSALAGASCLAGIGFTMAIFVATLGLDGPALLAAKTGILLGSALSLVLGMALLAWRLPSVSPQAVSDVDGNSA